MIFLDQPYFKCVNVWMMKGSLVISQIRYSRFSLNMEVLKINVIPFFFINQDIFPNHILVGFYQLKNTLLQTLQKHNNHKNLQTWMLKGKLFMQYFLSLIIKHILFLAVFSFNFYLYYILIIWSFFCDNNNWILNNANMLCII